MICAFLMHGISHKTVMLTTLNHGQRETRVISKKDDPNRGMTPQWRGCKSSSTTYRELYKWCHTKGKKKLDTTSSDRRHIECGEPSVHAHSKHKRLKSVSQSCWIAVIIYQRQLPSIAFLCGFLFIKQHVLCFFCSRYYTYIHASMHFWLLVVAAVRRCSGLHMIIESGGSKNKVLTWNNFPFIVSPLISNIFISRIWSKVPAVYPCL